VNIVLRKNGVRVCGLVDADVLQEEAADRLQKWAKARPDGLAAARFCSPAYGGKMRELDYGVFCKKVDPSIKVSAQMSGMALDGGARRW
jgi:hypothetical protein